MQASKTFLSEQWIIEQSFELAAQIYASHFRPSFIVGLWRGGSTVGIYVQECLQTLGVDTDHIAIRTSYGGAQHYADQWHDHSPDIQVHGTQYLIDTLSFDDRLLIVDDVFATGRNMCAVIAHLKAHLRRNLPSTIRSACLFEKPEQRRVALKPDYALHQTEDWLVLPYEIQGLTEEEIRQHKPFVLELAHRYNLGAPNQPSEP